MQTIHALLEFLTMYNLNLKNIVVERESFIRRGE